MNRPESLSGARIAASAGVMALVILAGCDKLPGRDGADAAAPARQAATLRVQDREVEHPEIYERTAKGLWDGRFSLGGRWVAVSDKVEAERVKIVNLDNDRQIEGALFRKEVDLPGPPIMVSMDAAEALGMQAGAPAQLRVVVVRKETVEIPAPAPAAQPAADAASTAAAAPGPVAAATVETSDLAAAAPAKPAAKPATPAAPAAAPSGRRIQVVAGGNREGADAVARKLKGESIAATVVASGTGEKPYYRVIAGPFPDGESLGAALNMIHSLGYKDAFAVK